jgi:hypothetical protein
MRRTRYAPTWEGLERMVLCDGDLGGLGPPPEIEPPPAGGVLDDHGGGDLTEAPPLMGGGPVRIDPTDPYA